VTRFVMSLGAGVYEESVFRLGLLSGLAFVLEKVVRIARWAALLGALVLSSVCSPLCTIFRPMAIRSCLARLCSECWPAFSLAFSSGGADSRSLSTPTPFTTSSCSSSDRGRNTGRLWPSCYLRFLAAGFLAAGFLAADFLAAGFLAADFLAAGFLAAGFLAAGFLAAGFLAAGFLAAGFLAAGFLAVGFETTGCLATGCFAIASGAGLLDATTPPLRAVSVGDSRAGVRAWAGAGSFLSLDLVPGRGLARNCTRRKPVILGGQRGPWDVLAIVNQDASRVRKGESPPCSPKQSPR